MSQHSEVLIEGYSIEEILAFPDDQIAPIIFCGRPLVFKIGTAEILGEFRRTPTRLIIELAQIDGGGEGVLPSLWILTCRYAQQNGIPEVEWIVHAIYCAHPNLKLRRLLNRLGFTIEDVPGIGEAYHLIVDVNTMGKLLSSN